MYVDEEIYLEHHGVKGMHWGISNKKTRISSGLHARLANHHQRVAKSFAVEAKKYSDWAKAHPNDPDVKDGSYEQAVKEIRSYGTKHLLLAQKHRSHSQ